MFYEIYTTDDDICYLALYAHSGNQYYYFTIDKTGVMETTKSLNDCYKNEHYIDYLSLDQLGTIEKLISLFKVKEKISENFSSDDIPF